MLKMKDFTWEEAENLARNIATPKEFRGRPHLCLQAMNFAKKLNFDAREALDALTVVRGRLVVRASTVMTLGVTVGPIRPGYRYTQSGEGDSLEVTCHAVLKTGEPVEAKVDMQMAHYFGWTKNPFYSGMPAHMLSYRAATALVRMTCPQVLMGMQTSQEVLDPPIKKVVRPNPFATLNDEIRALRA